MADTAHVSKVRLRPSQRHLETRVGPRNLGNSDEGDGKGLCQAWHGTLYKVGRQDSRAQVVLRSPKAAAKVGVSPLACPSVEHPW